MNKIINYLSIILFLFLPIIVKAQPPGEGWIRLGEFIDGKYKNEMSEIHHLDEKTRKELKSYDSTQDIYISKIAYKPIDKHSDPDAILYLIPVNIENGEIKTTNNVITISNDFVISENNEKIKTKNLPKEDGWTIYNFSNPTLLYLMEGLHNGYVNWKDDKLSRNPIFKNFYVFLDPDKDPAKVAKETAAKKRQEFDKTVFTTPQAKGWTPVKTETIKDGTIVEHYDEGIRHFRKPNGDFISFKQLEDERDSETLDMIKGMDKPFEKYKSYNPVGAYRLTLPNGIILQRDGINDEMIFKNGDKLFTEYDGSVYNPESTKLKNGDTAYPAIFPITYETLFEYDTYKTPDLKFFYFDTYTPEATYVFLRWNDYNKRFNNDEINIDIYNYNHFKPIKLKYLTNGSTEKDIILTAGDNFLKNRFMVFADPYDSNTFQVYYPHENGLKPYGFQYPELYTFQVVMTPLKVKETNINEKGEIESITLTNGDFFKTDRYGEVLEVHLSLSDGTLIEKFPDNDNFKVSTPSGDKFIGKINLGQFSNNVTINGEYLFKEGTLTTADGKKYEYYNYVNQTKRDADVAKLAAAVQKALYSKYGKSDVDEALAGNIKTGMKLQMLKDLNVPLTLDDESSTYAWYKMATDITYHGDVKYRWIRVNKSTGKIDYIGSQRTGGFMSY